MRNLATSAVLQCSGSTEVRTSKGTEVLTSLGITLSLSVSSMETAGDSCAMFGIEFESCDMSVGVCCDISVGVVGDLSVGVF